MAKTGKAKVPSALLKALSAHVQAAEPEDNSADEARAAMTKDRNETLAKIAKDLSKGVEDILGPISALADSSEKELPALVKAIDNLAQTITKVGAQVVEAIYAPQRLTKDAKGLPDGVHRVRKV